MTNDKKTRKLILTIRNNAGKVHVRFAADRDISYPTLRLRLDKVIEIISSPMPQEVRRQKNVLDALEDGGLSAAQAEEILKNKENSEEEKPA